MAEKSVFLAYLFFLIGGLFSLHLLYLKRSRQAVLYCCTFGGFWMGLLYDLVSIPRYCSEANLDEDYIEVHMARRRQKRVDISWERCVAEVVFGYLLGFVSISAFSDSFIHSHLAIYYLFLCIIGPTAAAYGVWFVGGIGTQRLEFLQSLLGSLLTIPLLLRNGPVSLLYSAIGAAVWANYRGNRIRALEELNLEQKESYFSHLSKFSLFVLVVYALWFSTFYNNATITTGDGVEVPVSEAVRNFINSQAFKDFKAVLTDFVATFFSHGPGQAWHRFLKLSDPLGEEAAFAALELQPGASEAEIERQCRKMLRDHHPDRFQDEKRKKEEHDIFLNVQVACDRLSTIRQRRIKRNRQSVTNEEL